MSDKLNHSDLSALLAKEAKISGAKAELFTKAMFELIIEGLEQDGIVKINGLGTFKITDVADRSSVNVNTGEKIEIKGHKKITFLPADTLKESVNRPFAMFEPVEVDDDYQDEDDNDTNGSNPVSEEKDEIISEPFNVSEIEEEMPLENEDNRYSEVKKTILVEEEQSKENNDDATPDVTEKTITKEEVQTEEEEIADTEKTPEESTGKTVEKDDNRDTVVEETTDNEPSTKETVEADCVKESPLTSEKDTPAQTDDVNENNAAPVKKRNGIWRFAIYVTIGFICGFAAIKMMDRNHTTDEADRNVAVSTVPNQEITAETKNQPEAIVADVVDSEAMAEPVVPIENTQTVNEAEVDTPYTFVMIEELASRSDRSIKEADTTHYVMTGQMTVHTVAADERLAKISNDYYGSRKLWPYIAKYNNLKKPYGLAIGMELIIPELQPK